MPNEFHTGGNGDGGGGGVMQIEGVITLYSHSNFFLFLVIPLYSKHVPGVDKEGPVDLGERNFFAVEAFFFFLKTIRQTKRQERKREKNSFIGNFLAALIAATKRAFLRPKFPY